MCTPRQPQPERSGNIAVFALFLMIIMLSVVALAVDVGYLNVVDSELQRSADASAMAATWRLLEHQPPTSSVTSSAITTIRSTAGQYAGLNVIATSAPALGEGDSQVGYLAYPFTAGGSLSFSTPSKFNAVTIRVRRTAEQNGAVGLFFARVMGHGSASLEASATAAFLNNVVGFRAPKDGSNSDILPITVDKPTWDSLIAGTTGTDRYAYDSNGRSVSSGGDGVKEIALYPGDTGEPGNLGAVDIGGADNSTTELSRQIRHGPTKEDLAYHGGELKFNGEGKLHLTGDTGLSAATKDDFDAIIGQVKVIPLYESVVNPGNNATYTIVKWVGVRVMHVRLVGVDNKKQVVIQPAKIIAKGAIGGQDGAGTSEYVYSPAWLVK